MQRVLHTEMGVSRTQTLNKIKVLERQEEKELPPLAVSVIVVPNKIRMRFEEEDSKLESDTISMKEESP